MICEITRDILEKFTMACREYPRLAEFVNNAPVEERFKIVTAIAFYHHEVLLLRWSQENEYESKAIYC